MGSAELVSLKQMEPEKKAKAIAAFRAGCSWREVAEATGIGRTTLWRWAKTDEQFAKDIEEAQAGPDIEVEAVTFQNACDPDPANNTLRMFWLKSRMRSTYYEEKVIHHNSVDGIFEMVDDGRDPSIPLPSINGHCDGTPALSRSSPSRSCS